MRLTGEKNTNCVRGPEEILSESGNRATVRNGDGAIVAVSVVVDGLLIVLELDGN